jgi:hypothetical protein
MPASTIVRVVKRDFNLVFLLLPGTRPAAKKEKRAGRALVKKSLPTQALP